jgi:hypothetical protein
MRWMVLFMVAACSSGPVDFTPAEVEGEYVVTFHFANGGQADMLISMGAQQDGLILVAPSGYTFATVDEGVLTTNGRLCRDPNCTGRVAAGARLEYDGSSFAGPATLEDAAGATRVHMVMARR